MRYRVNGPVARTKKKEKKKRIRKAKTIDLHLHADLIRKAKTIRKAKIFACRFNKKSKNKRSAFADLIRKAKTIDLHADLMIHLRQSRFKLFASSNACHHFIDQIER